MNPEWNDVPAICRRVPSHGPSRLLLCSTGPSRTLLTSPELTGSRYREALREAVAQSLVAALATDERLEHAFAGGSANVLTVLRGGLSFDLPAALHRAGVESTVSFVGTTRDESGVTVPYERWELEDGPVVLGDIVATGNSVRAALTRLRLDMAARGRTVDHVLLVTIAAGEGLRVAGEVLAAEGCEATIIALEAAFTLPAGPPPPGIARHWFDLIRTAGYHPAPEFELERLRRFDSLFEKCAIYDGGMRSFHPRDHDDLRSGWWSQVTAAVGGSALADLGRAVAGLDMYGDSFERWRVAAGWAGSVPDDVCGEIFTTGRQALLAAREMSIGDYVRDTLRSTGFPLSTRSGT